MFLFAFRQISYSHFDLSYATNTIDCRDQEQDKVRSIEANDILILLSLDLVT